MNMSDYLSRLLANQRLQPGDVVAAVGDNSAEIWALLKATEALGLALAIINDSWSARLRAQLLTKLGAQLVIGYGPRGRQAAESNQVDCWLAEDGSSASEIERQTTKAARVSSHLAGSVEGALIFCTSGSTGDPKCVVSTPRNRQFSSLTIGKYLGLTEGQCIVNALSPSFDYGLYQGLLAERFGLGLDLVRSAQMTGELLERIRRGRRVVLPLTPALAARLCRGMSVEECFPSVEIVSLTGGATSAGLRQKLAAAFPNAKIFAMYGLTECKRVAYLEPAEFLRRPYSCGREMAGVTAEIVGEDGKAVEQGAIGELTIEGENVCLGYWADPEATLGRFRKAADGRVILFTGDRFRRDQDGFLEFISRNDEQVKLRDERVSLAAIEKELRTSKLVLDLALRIEQDDLGIPLITACVVPENPSISSGEVLRSFRDCISKPGHLPHSVVLVNEIAITEHGKHVGGARTERVIGNFAA
jgi:acyl-coenzyme A synthetase/AMP-(fatty) acid ligase